MLVTTCDSGSGVAWRGSGCDSARDNELELSELLFHFGGCQVEEGAEYSDRQVGPKRENLRQTPNLGTLPENAASQLQRRRLQGEGDFNLRHDHDHSTIAKVITPCILDRN